MVTPYGQSFLIDQVGAIVHPQASPPRPSELCRWILLSGHPAEPTFLSFQSDSGCYLLKGSFVTGKTGRESAPTTQVLFRRGHGVGTRHTGHLGPLHLEEGPI